MRHTKETTLFEERDDEKPMPKTNVAAGSTTRFKSVEPIIPPNCTTARGAKSSPPGLFEARIIGISPITVVSDVKMIGVMRSALLHGSFQITTAGNAFTITIEQKDSIAQCKTNYRNEAN